MYAMLADGKDSEQLEELDAALAEVPGDKELANSFRIGA